MAQVASLVAKSCLESSEVKTVGHVIVMPDDVAAVIC
jgi:hypothetical protein